MTPLSLAIFSKSGTLPASRADSASALTDLYEIEEIWELVAHAQRRGRAPLGPWVEIRQRVPAVTQSSDAAPASLQDCDRFLKLLVRRKAESMSRCQRTELRRVMHGVTHLLPLGDTFSSLDASR
jgi:hypothetical protein